MLTQNLGSKLAVPQLVRRNVSGRYTVRYRLKGKTVPLVSLSLMTTNRQEALSRMNELSNAAKLFLLDRPDATPEELNARLKEFAETLLTDNARVYWSHDGDIDHLGDLVGHLRTLSLDSRSVAHQSAIKNALRVLQAASERVQHGDPSALVDELARLEAHSYSSGDTSGDATAILSDTQGSTPSDLKLAPVVFNAAQPLWSSLVEDCIAEKRLTLKDASIKDLTSSLRTISKFIPAEGADLMARLMWLGVRDTMVAAGLAVGTINKCITKASMVIEYALMNQKLTGRNPIERLKLKAVESNRKPFSRDQLVTLASALPNIKEAHRRALVALGLLTGARIGELVQLTHEDIYQIDGQWFVDINDDNGKTLKNANSKRLVPLCDGLYGVAVGQLIEDVKAAESRNETVCKVSRDSASKWFNEVYAPATLSDHAEGLTFHSLRHSMATECKAAGVSEVDAGSILGHKAQSITYGLYGKTQALGRLIAAVEYLKNQ